MKECINLLFLMKDMSCTTYTDLSFKEAVINIRKYLTGSPALATSCVGYMVIGSNSLPLEFTYMTDEYNLMEYFRISKNFYFGTDEEKGAAVQDWVIFNKNHNRIL
ncbi:MAG: hypothetical protein JWP44_5008 [Mucilaginibacter sp.]|nr:hypothetical protein [Mucilaginibacter sp.]